MDSTQTLHTNDNTIVTDINKNKKSLSGFFTSLKKGLRAAAVTKMCPNDKEAMVRILSED